MKNTSRLVFPLMEISMHYINESLHTQNAKFRACILPTSIFCSAVVGEPVRDNEGSSVSAISERFVSLPPTSCCLHAKILFKILFPVNMKTIYCIEMLWKLGNWFKICLKTQPNTDILIIPQMTVNLESWSTVSCHWHYKSITWAVSVTTTASTIGCCNSLIAHSLSSRLINNVWTTAMVSKELHLKWLPFPHKVEFKLDTLA